jgi:hypothetical protein
MNYNPQFLFPQYHKRFRDLAKLILFKYGEITPLPNDNVGNQTLIVRSYSMPFHIDHFQKPSAAKGPKPKSLFKHFLNTGLISHHLPYQPPPSPMRFNPKTAIWLILKS